MSDLRSCGDEEGITLLALYFSSRGASRTALVRALLREREPGGAILRLAERPRFRPTAQAWREAERAWWAVQAKDIVVVPVHRLPQHYRGMAPPLALFVRGDRMLLDRRGWGVVGSRKASPAVLAWLGQVWPTLDPGLLVSGGAAGVDAEAHHLALASGVPSIAFLGVPADEVFPTGNESLFADVIARGGALVSELPPLVAAGPHYHARRNRFIAGASDALLVAQAGLRSGTMGTAKYAHKLGVPIYTCPLEAGDLGLRLLEAEGLATRLPF